MNKRKNKSQNPLSYWWNEFLFARYFELETDISPEDLADNLRGLAHKHQGWLWGLLKTSNVTMHPNQKGLDFDIQSKRKRKWDIFALTSARAQGSAIVDSGTGLTIVRGSAKLGRLFHIVLIFYLAYFLFVIPALFRTEFGLYGAEILFPALAPLIILGSMMGFYWWRMYADRNDLAQLIEDAAYSAKAKRASRRLSDAEDENDTDWLYEDEAYDQQER